MKTKTPKSGRFPTLPADYIKLIRRFPLCPLRSEQDCEQAMLAIRPLAMKGVEVDGKDDLTPGERDYLQTMTMLIEEYERNIAGLGQKDLVGHKLLTNLLEDREISGNQLAKVLGVSQSLASLVLSGKRNISTDMARKLAEYFGLPAHVFLDL